MTEPPQIDLDNYDIIECIGKGRFSVVCKGRDKITGKEVVIKAYRPVYEEKGLGNPFLYIYRKACQSFFINSPFLAKSIGIRMEIIGEEKANSKYLQYKVKGLNEPVDFTGFIIVTDYVKNHDIVTPMNEYIDTKGEKHDLINPTIRSKIIFGVSSIMKQIHAKNLNYKHLKLENIYLTDELEPLIADFSLSDDIGDRLGIQTFEDNDISVYSAPEILSSFMSDSEIEYEIKQSSQIDVYDYAMLLYCMFSTKFKFNGKEPRSIQQFIHNICKGMRPDKPEIMPDHYWELVQKCWRQDPDERPSFDEITEILRNDKYALEEFGMSTNIDELHQFQDKIESK